MKKDYEGHWPVRIVELMRGRNVLTVALDLIGGVRGTSDLCLSDCANDLTVLEWYIDKWEPSDCPFDQHALALIKISQELAQNWFHKTASDIGFGKGAAMKNMNDPRSDEHKHPEGDMNANPTRPFYVDTDRSHYVVRENATGRSMTKRCTFDEADHACNLLNYGWRACAKHLGVRSDEPLQACRKLLKLFESMDGEAGGVSMTNEDAAILRSAIARAEGGEG